MPVSYEQFMEATGAELVCGNIIVGAMADRRKVGDISDDGVFNLNDDGKAMVAEIEAGQKPSTAKSKKKVAAEPEAPAAGDPRLVDPT
jgi:hypothetical protein